jgi:hypothetical protein
MRVIAVENSAMDDDQDDVLADAILSSYEEINGLDDIATPGSFSYSTYWVSLSTFYCYCFD